MLHPIIWLSLILWYWSRHWIIPYSGHALVSPSSHCKARRGASFRLFECDRRGRGAPQFTQVAFFWMQYSSPSKSKWLVVSTWFLCFTWKSKLELPASLIVLKFMHFQALKLQTTRQKCLPGWTDIVIVLPINKWHGNQYILLACTFAKALQHIYYHTKVLMIGFYWCGLLK